MLFHWLAALLLVPVLASTDIILIQVRSACIGSVDGLAPSQKRDGRKGFRRIGRDGGQRRRRAAGRRFDQGLAHQQSVRRSQGKRCAMSYATVQLRG